MSKQNRQLPILKSPLKELYNLAFNRLLAAAVTIIVNFMQLISFFNSSFKVKAVGHCAACVYSRTNTIIERAWWWVNKFEAKLYLFQ